MKHPRAQHPRDATSKTLASSDQNVQITSKTDPLGMIQSIQERNIQNCNIQDHSIQNRIIQIGSNQGRGIAASKSETSKGAASKTVSSKKHFWYRSIQDRIIQNSDICCTSWKLLVQWLSDRWWHVRFLSDGIV